MSRYFGSLSLIIALVAGSVCAQEGAEGDGAADTAAGEAEEVVLDPNTPPSTAPACFSVRGVRNFSALHNQYIYVQGRRDQHYLLTMERSCLGLRSSEGIEIENHTDRVCSNSQAGVSYRASGGRLETCYIRQVEAVEDRAAARIIVESRTRR